MTTQASSANSFANIFNVFIPPYRNIAKPLHSASGVENRSKEQNDSTEFVPSCLRTFLNITAKVTENKIPGTRDAQLELWTQYCSSDLRTCIFKGPDGEKVRVDFSTWPKIDSSSFNAAFGEPALERLIGATRPRVARLDDLRCTWPQEDIDFAMVHRKFPKR